MCDCAKIWQHKLNKVKSWSRQCLKFLCGCLMGKLITLNYTIQISALKVLAQQKHISNLIDFKFSSVLLYKWKTTADHLSPWLSFNIYCSPLYHPSWSFVKSNKKQSRRSCLAWRVWITKMCPSVIINTLRYAAHNHQNWYLLPNSQQTRYGEQYQPTSDNFWFP